MKRGESFRTTDLVMPSKGSFEERVRDEELQGQFMQLSVLLRHEIGLEAFMKYLFKGFLFCSKLKKILIG